MFFLGRNYMYNERWHDAIKILKKYFNVFSKDQKYASMRYIARCYNNLNKKYKTKKWYKKAIKFNPNYREAYVELAYFYYVKRKYKKAYKLLTKSFNCFDKGICYDKENFAWNGFIYDLYSNILFNLKKYDESYNAIKEGLKIDNNNLRLLINLDLIERYIKKSDN